MAWSFSAERQHEVNLRELLSDIQRDQHETLSRMVDHCSRPNYGHPNLLPHLQMLAKTSPRFRIALRAAKN
jgi:hypothetical protein